MRGGVQAGAHTRGATWPAPAPAGTAGASADSSSEPAALQAHICSTSLMASVRWSTDPQPPSRQTRKPAARRAGRPRPAASQSSPRLGRRRPRTGRRTRQRSGSLRRLPTVTGRHRLPASPRQLGCSLPCPAAPQSWASLQLRPGQRHRPPLPAQRQPPRQQRLRQLACLLRTAGSAAGAACRRRLQGRAGCALAAHPPA